MGAVDEAAVSHDSNFSIHSPEAIRFMEKEVKASQAVLGVLKEGLVFDFAKQPSRYSEKNNRSATEHLDVVRGKVQEWLRDGYVEKLDGPAHCVNPLSVVLKYDPVSDVSKYRVVLDLSRHVNGCIVNRSSKLEDLSVTEAAVEPGEFLTAFDLKNQFFHVRLHESQKKFFGFAVPDEKGVMQFYQFQILVYGSKPAVAVVTDLLKPVKAYLHRQGVKLSIYVDDGRVGAGSEPEARAKTSLVLSVMQLAGWNIQWAKTTVDPVQQLLYLGFITDTVKMAYYTPLEKLELLAGQISDTVAAAEKGEPLAARHLAQVVGRVAALRRSHGNIVCVMSRSVQHELGVHTLDNGWDTSLFLSDHSVKELCFLMDIVFECNGQFIFSAASVSYNMELSEIIEKVQQVMATEENMPDLFVSDASDSHAFVYRADGAFDFVADFEFTAEQAASSSSHRELQAVRLALLQNESYFSKLAPLKIFWQTDSRNLCTFLSKGSKKPSIQKHVFEVKKLEKKLNVMVIAIWTPREHGRIFLADLGSKFSLSTDEWSVDRDLLYTVLFQLNLMPSVDCFATRHNKVCAKFFSVLPQTGTAGINFFAQKLSAAETYFCCPPVKLIIPCFLKLVSEKGIKAVLLVPEWHSAVFWPFLFNGVNVRPHVSQVLPFQAKFFYTNQAQSHVFCRDPKFRMLALKIET